MNARPHVIVVGNEKGGTGKSTVAMHLVVGFLRRGYRVASIDLDARQATLSRYLDNRRARIETCGADLPMPAHGALLPGAGAGGEPDDAADEARLKAEVERLGAGADILLIDTPGSDSALSRAGHALADTLITPLNDSFIDLDVLAKVDPEDLRILRPSHYAEMVWETRKRRALSGRKAMQWIVTRNRLSHVDSRNKRDMERLVGDLARRIGFVTVPGLGERVIYRELFLKGLTLLDLTREEGAGMELSMSHVAARQELRGILEAVDLPLAVD